MSLTPSIVLCKLYERQARKSGQTYFAGRLGAASVVLLRTDETSDSGQPVWVLKVSEPLPRTDATQLRKPESSIRPQPIEALRVPPTRSHFDHDHRNPNERQSKAAKRHCAQRAMSVRSARHWAPCPVAAFAFGKPLTSIAPSGMRSVSHSRRGPLSRNPQQSRARRKRAGRANAKSRWPGSTSIAWLRTATARTAPHA